MSVAQVTPIDRRSTEEPTNLRELYERAQADTVTRGPAVYLRWVFWHARATARLEAAKLCTAKLDQRERDVRLVLCSMTIPSMRAVLEEGLPTAATMRQAEEMLVEAHAMAEATRLVMELLAAKR